VRIICQVFVHWAAHTKCLLYNCSFSVCFLAYRNFISSFILYLMALLVVFYDLMLLPHFDRDIYQVSSWKRNKVYINVARSTKRKDVYCWTGKKYTPKQEQQIKIAQDKRSHLVQQIMQDERLTQKYISIKVSGNNMRSKNTTSNAIRYRINEEIKFL